MRMAAAWIIGVVAVASTLRSGSAETQAECLNRCISRCVDARGGLCTFNCALGCHWPFAQPTGEVLVTAQGAAGHGDAAAMQAAFAVHKEPAPATGGQGTPAPTTQQNPN